MTELKNCPFCGGKNIKIDYCDMPKSEKFYCYCSDCSDKETLNGEYAKNPFQAKQAWNTRANEMTWRTIDSAPRDKEIIIFVSGEGVGTGIFSNSRNNSWTLTVMGQWAIESEDNYWGREFFNGRYPTHWMPLPSAPDSEGK